MRVSRLFLILTSLIILWGCNKTSNIIYVSPDGSDNFPGTIDKPLKTFSGAVKMVRNLIHVRKGDIVVEFADGIYRFRETVILGSDDSGSPKQQIIYRAAEGANPVFTSGVNIKGWKKISTDDPVYSFLPEKAGNEVYVAEMPDGIDRLLFLKDNHTDWLELAKVNVTDWVTTEKFIHGNSVEGQMWDPPEEKKYCTFSKSMDDLSNIDNALIFSIYTADFELQIVPVDDITENTLTSSTPGGHRLALPEEGQQHESNELAFLHNLAEGINSPGKFASYPGSRKIYLWPATDTAEIFTPTLNELIRMEGVDKGTEAWFSKSVEKPIRNIIFDGITFTNCKYSLWFESDVSAQHDWALLDKENALLRMRGAEMIVIKNCTFSKSGGAGIAFDLYAQNNVVVDCQFESLGYEAIRFCGYGIGTKDENKNNVVQRCEISKVNEVHQYGAAIVVWNSGYNLIANNYIHDFASRAVLLSAPRCRAFTKNNQALFPSDRVMREQAWPMARWDEVPDSALATVIFGNRDSRWEEVNGVRKLYKDRFSAHFRYLRGNVVKQNVIENGAQELFADALIYVTACATGESNKIIENYFCNTGKELPHANIPFRMIYVDGFTGDFEIERNFIYNSRFKFEMIAPYSWWGDVTISANIFYDSESGDPYFGEDEDNIIRYQGSGNLCRGDAPHNPNRKYLKDYKNMIYILESDEWVGPDIIPGLELIKNELSSVINELE